VTTAAGVPARELGVLGLARLLCRARIRHSFNVLRARPTGVAGLLLLLGVGSAVPT
jgi:hypothetical protein